MIRAGISAGAIFVVAALLWILFDPIVTHINVGRLQESSEISVQDERALIMKGRGATRALRLGMASDNVLQRLRSARLLAVLGDPSGQTLLLDALVDPELAAHHDLVENMLLGIWDQRKGPDSAKRANLLRESFHPSKSINRKMLDHQLELHPAWVGGYLARSRIHFEENEILQAREDALSTLLLESNHFEAIVLLARCQLMLDRPNLARICFEQALKIHPGLYDSIESDLKTARKEAAAVQKHRRIQAKKEKPAA